MSDSAGYTTEYTEVESEEDIDELLEEWGIEVPSEEEAEKE